MVPSELALRLLRTMLRIRRMEERCIDLAASGQIRAHYHLYIGQEAAGTGACAALHPHDHVFTTHRNHGHVVAKGGDPGRVLAEIIGRSGGYLGGRGGTFHVAAPDIGILHTSAIVGGSLPIAAGVALAVRRRRGQRATLAFFGDGTMEEGVFAETLNIARLWSLPLIFYMENNSVSARERAGRGSPTSEHSAKALSDVPRAFDIETALVDGTDVEAVHALVRGLVERVRFGEGPFFVESRTTRWPGNYGSFPKLAGGATEIRWAWEPATAPDEIRAWTMESDPVIAHAARLLWRGTIDRVGLERLDADVRAETDAAARFALASPPPVAEGVAAGGR
jgi:pyruvate dehydrogenase E1 component alpha subunit